MDGIPYEKQNIEEIAKRQEYEIMKIIEFLKKIENFSKNAVSILSNIVYIYNKNNAEILNCQNERKSQKSKKAQFLQNRQKVENLQKLIFPNLSQIEQKRQESEKAILVACEIYDKLIKKGYDERMIHQAVYSASRDQFWSKQFRSLAKLLRKNKDDIYYIDIFLSIDQKNHKISIPKIVR
jgi:hypothetical protein